MKRNNSEYDFRLIDDQGCEKFMEEHFSGEVADAYFSINPKLGAARADLWRYCVLYKHGGVYLDIDSLIVKPLDEWIKPDDHAIISYETNKLNYGILIKVGLRTHLPGKLLPGSF